MRLQFHSQIFEIFHKISKLIAGYVNDTSYSEALPHEKKTTFWIIHVP